MESPFNFKCPICGKNLVTVERTKIDRIYGIRVDTLSVVCPDDDCPNSAAKLNPLWDKQDAEAPRNVFDNPDYGHLSEMQVRLMVRTMDEAAGKKYDPGEAFDSQAKRLATQLRDEVKDLPDGAVRRGNEALVAELEAGFVTHRGEGTLEEYDKLREGKA